MVRNDRKIWKDYSEDNPTNFFDINSKIKNHLGLMNLLKKTN